MISSKRELWSDIKGYEGQYQVSTRGRIKRLEHYTEAWNRHKTCKRKLPELIMKLSSDKDGYKVVSIKKKSYRVHRLVGLAFLKRRSDATQINHKNGIKDDNRVENLEFVTPSENYTHAYDTGLNNGPRGSINGASVLDESDIHYIKKLLESGFMLQKDIAKKFGVTPSTISDIKNGRTWSHLTNYKYNGRMAERRNLCKKKSMKGLKKLEGK